MKQYEAPKMSFEELSLFEKIADVCWGGSSFILDNPATSETENYPIQLTDKAKCGQEDAIALLEQAQVYLGVEAFNLWKATYVDNNNSKNLANVNIQGITMIKS